MSEDIRPVCPVCGKDMDSLSEGCLDGETVEVFEWGCFNRECTNSPFYHPDSKFVKQNSKSFDFEQYKKFRKRCKKRSKR